MANARCIKVGDKIDCDYITVKRLRNDNGVIKSIDGKEYMCYPIEHNKFTITFVDDKRYNIEKCVEIAKHTRKNKRGDKLLAVGISTDFMPKKDMYVRAMVVSAEEVLDANLLKEHINDTPQTMWFRTHGMCANTPDIPRCPAPVEII